MKTLCRFFLMQALAYGIVDASNRFVAQANTPWAISTAMLYAWLAFYVIKRVGEAKSRLAVVGYIAGSGLGTYVGIVASRFISGQ